MPITGFRAKATRNSISVLETRVFESKTGQASPRMGKGYQKGRAEAGRDYVRKH
jgi:hypothetical protein